MSSLFPTPYVFVSHSHSLSSTFQSLLDKAASLFPKPSTATAKTPWITLGQDKSAVLLQDAFSFIRDREILVVRWEKPSPPTSVLKNTLKSSSPTTTNTSKGVRWAEKHSSLPHSLPNDSSSSAFSSSSSSSSLASTQQPKREGGRAFRAAHVKKVLDEQRLKSEQEAREEKERSLLKEKAEEEITQARSIVEQAQTPAAEVSSPSIETTVGNKQAEEGIPSQLQTESSSQSPFIKSLSSFVQGPVRLSSPDEQHSSLIDSSPLTFNVPDEGVTMILPQRTTLSHTVAPASPPTSSPSPLHRKDITTGDRENDPLSLVHGAAKNQLSISSPPNSPSSHAADERVYRTLRNVLAALKGHPSSFALRAPMPSDFLEWSEKHGGAIGVYTRLSLSLGSFSDLHSLSSPFMIIPPDLLILSRRIETKSFSPEQDPLLSFRASLNQYFSNLRNFYGPTSAESTSGENLRVFSETLLNEYARKDRASGGAGGGRLKRGVESESIGKEMRKGREEHKKSAREIMDALRIGSGIRSNVPDALRPRPRMPARRTSSEFYSHSKSKVSLSLTSFFSFLWDFFFKNVQLAMNLMQLSYKR